MRHQPPERIRIQRFPECRLDATWQDVNDRHPQHGQEVEAHTSDCRTIRATWNRVDRCWYRGCVGEDVVAWRSIGKRTPGTEGGEG